MLKFFHIKDSRQRLTYVTLKVRRRIGGMNSGMPSAPARLSWVVACPLPGAWRFTLKVYRRRRSEFRDAKCARRTFMGGGASAAGRMEVYFLKERGAPEPAAPTALDPGPDIRLPILPDRRRPASAHSSVSWQAYGFSGPLWQEGPAPFSGDDPGADPAVPRGPAANQIKDPALQNLCS